MSFYFITLTASSLVSYYYSVRDFGEYSLANSISNAVTMAGGAFLFIFYPKMISKFSTKNREDHRLFIERIRYIYILAIDIVTIISVILIPLVGIILPDYTMLIELFALLMLGKLFNNATSGYATYLITKSRERELIVIGFSSILLMLVMGMVIGHWLNNILYMVILVAVVSFFYSICVIVRGRKMLKSKLTMRTVLGDILGNGRYVILISILTYVFSKSFWVICVASLFFLFLNGRRVVNLCTVAYNILIDNKNIKI